MVTYKVKIEIQKSREAEWVKWMKEKHIRDVVNTGYFIDFDFKKFNIIENGKPLNDSVATYEIEYLCKSIEDYKAYRDNSSVSLQKEHKEKFDGYFTADRVIYTTEEVFDFAPIEQGM